MFMYWFYASDALRVVIVIAIIFYLLPFTIALQRGATSPFSLLLVNLLFGWTVVGWIACLVWATSMQTKTQARFYARAERMAEREDRAERIERRAERQDGDRARMSRLSATR